MSSVVMPVFTLRLRAGFDITDHFLSLLLACIFCSDEQFPCVVFVIIFFTVRARWEFDALAVNHIFVTTGLATVDPSMFRVLPWFPELCIPVVRIFLLVFFYVLSIDVPCHVNTFP